ncbi:MAG: S-adenosylmethionine:tRNA ribosyltransferase-isomerase, partial [Polyangiaceae bacterium]
MRAATWAREDRMMDRLLLVDRRGGGLADRTMRDLPGSLGRGDVLVVNDSATLPASLSGRGPLGEAIELRLLGMAVGGGESGSLGGGEAEEVGSRWTGVLFGEGDYRMRTEDRPAPPRVRAGDRLSFGGGGAGLSGGLSAGLSAGLAAGLAAIVEEVSPVSPRLVTVRMSESGGRLLQAIYRLGRPVQYSYVTRPLALWDVQTAYSGRPWSVEEPSAGRSLTVPLLAELRERGVEIATLTHAAGLSATGDPALDARLPLPERYRIPEETARAVERARRGERRVVAVGTSVVRALEGCFAEHGRLVAGSGVTDLRLGPETRLRVVTDLLTGMHEPGTSHFELLQAFASRAVVEEAHAHAEATG